MGRRRGSKRAFYAPTNITWAGTQSIAENAALGSAVGGLLSATDPDPIDTVAFSLVDNAGGRFGISFASVIVTGVLDYETATSHSITIRATDSGGYTFDKAFTVTVTNVTETTPDLPPGGGTVIVDDPAGFVVPPTVVGVDDAIAFQGNKKKGSSGKFVFDIGAPVAGNIYTMKYDPDWSMLENGGKTAMVGFGLRQSNDFRISGLKGDRAVGLNAYEVFGANKWNQTAGFSVNDGGPTTYGTQAGPNWLQFEVSANGATYTLRTSPDGTAWTDEFTAIVPTPFANVTGVASFGIAVFLDASDAGPFRVDITLWQVGAPGVPSILTNVIGWWDASVAASLTLSGTDILGVADQSGHANNLVWQVAKPTYNATGFNSTKPAIVFTSPVSSQTLNVPSFALGTGNTLTIWVVTTMAGAASQNYGRWFSYSAGVNDFGAANVWLFAQNNASTTQCVFMRNNISIASSSVTAAPAPHRLIVTVNAGAVTVYIDGVSVGTGTSAGNWAATGLLRIGNDPVSVISQIVAPIAECGISTDFHNATVVGQLDTYLKTKWGL